MITQEQALEIFKELSLNKKTYKDLAEKYNAHPSTLCTWMKSYKEYFGIKKDEKYCAKTYLRFMYKEDIIEKYLSGQSTKSIAQSYGLSDDHMIALLLQEFNIPIRSVGYQSRTNQLLFKEITNEYEAYTLGLITADGNVGKDYQVSITLVSSDSDVLRQINDHLYEGTGHFIESSTSRKNPITKLTICGKAICNNLAQYGVVPNKSHLLKEITILSDELMPHYIRGLYDGDGVCAKTNEYLRVGYCAYHKSFTKSYQDFLINTLGLKENKLFNTGNCWDCSWSKREDLEKFYNYIYKDATIFLQRKYDKLKNYLYGNTEVTS